MNSHWDQIINELFKSYSLADVKVTDGNLKVGRGPRAIKRELDYSPLIEAFGEQAQDLDLLAKHSLLRGMEAVASTPRGKTLDDDEFIDAAGRICVTLEGDAYAIGFELFSGETPWMLPLGDGLNRAYTVEVETGYVPLTHRTTDRWAVSDDRIERAAMSALYYRTGFGELEPVEGQPLLNTYKLGDGFDAARALILELLDYHRACSGMLVSIPSPDTLLFCDDTQEGLDCLIEYSSELAKSDEEVRLYGGIMRIQNGRLDPQSVATF